MIETINALKEVFDLAINAKKFIDEISDSVKKSKKHNEDKEKIISSGYGARIGSSGYGARIGSSGDGARIGSSGDGAQIGSSGDGAQIGSSGNWAKIGSSGDGARIGSSGENSVISAIGLFSVVKAKKGSWITLAEYKKGENDRYVVDYVKTEKVDGIKIKEDTFYCLYNHEFHEAINVDDIWSVLISKKRTVYKVVNFRDTYKSFIVEKDGIFSHGKTIKEAKESLIYKISNRDTSEYDDWTLNKKITKAEAIKSYRVITGACEAGTRYFMEHLDKIPKVITPKVVIELTVGQYGHDKYKEFFEK